MAARLTTYDAFWSFYLKEHSKPLTRGLHYMGTGLVILLFGLGLFYETTALFFMPVAGYGFAWTSHIFIEKNRPATFTYPWWSLISDFRMFGLWITGRLRPHLKLAGLS
ncbi:MAG: DUF962 domain-containing protein [Rhodospirillaceae bacterium]|jgi:hypothetical protein